MSHKYKVELDLIISAGSEGVRRIAQSDNIIYIDRGELERAATDKKNPYHQDIVYFLDWKNDLESEQPDYARRRKAVRLPSGATLSWAKPEPGTKYLTKDPVKRSKLLNEGKEVQFPEVLKFTTEPLESGILRGNYNGDLEKMTLEEAKSLFGVEDFYPYQKLIMNGSAIYQVRRDLIPTGPRRSRFSLGEKTALERIRIDRRDGIFPLPGSILENLSAWNLEQRIAWDQLVSDDIELSFLTGGSGSGKTVLAYGAALQLILEGSRIVHGNKLDVGKTRSYDGIVLFKTNDIIGGEHRQFGFLKGDLKEKAWPFMKSYKDAHELSGAGKTGTSFEQMLMHPHHGNDFSPHTRQAKLHINGRPLPENREAIEVEHLQFARGRTFTNRLIIIDEAQNYSPNEMKQLLERFGEGCKIMVLGDSEQVDGEKYGLSPAFNGLVWAANTHYGVHPRVSFMQLDQNYRSQTAEITRRRRAPRVIL